MITPTQASFLRAAIKARKSVVVAGPQGAGKTTMVRALCAEINPWEAIGTFETEFELHLHELVDVHPIVHAWEARPGSGEVGPDGKEREVEVEVTPSRPAFDMFAAPGGQPPEGMENFTDMLSDMLPKRRKKRTVKVSEARRILLEQEYEKLVDMEDVTADALERVAREAVIDLGFVERGELTEEQLDSALDVLSMTSPKA